MNLDRVTAELRPRSAWEAVDFGARMVRRDAAPIYKLWFIVTLPLLLLCAAGTWYTPWAGWFFFIYWWFEPVADGPILQVISRRLFGDDPNVRASLRALPALTWRNKLFWLTPYRLHFARSIAMPVTQLEGLKGAARRKRARVLNGNILGVGIGVTAVYQHLVLAVSLGVVLLIYLLIPIEVIDSVGEEWLFSFWDPDQRRASLQNLLLFYVAQTVLQPWFVGAGFGLYINCRTQLEAWDLEVAFRRMVQRRARRAGVAAAGLALVAAFLLSPVDYAVADKHARKNPAPGTETAEQQPDPGFSGYWANDSVQPALENAYATDALQPYEIVEQWRRIKDDDEEQEEEADSGNVDTVFRTIAEVLSVIVEFGIWVLVGIALLILYRTRHRWLAYLDVGAPTGKRRRRVLLASGEITAESLPDDVPQAVRDLWAEGRYREALSALYRASVFAAVTEHGVRVPVSATEGACVAAVDAQVDAGQSGFFRRIVAAWIHCAYGAQPPSAEVVEALCREWPQYYQGAVT